MRRTDLPGQALDLDQMPRLRRGRCNYCGRKMKLRQPTQIVCSTECRKGWDSFIQIFGRALAVRALHHQQAKETSPTETVQGPDGRRRKRRRLNKTGKRAFNEMDRIARHAWKRLKALHALNEDPVFEYAPTGMPALDANRMPEIDPEGQRWTRVEHRQIKP